MGFRGMGHGDTSLVGQMLGGVGTTLAVPGTFFLVEEGSTAVCPRQQSFLSPPGFGLASVNFHVLGWSTVGKKTREADNWF